MHTIIGVCAALGYMFLALLLLFFIWQGYVWNKARRQDREAEARMLKENDRW